MSERLERMLNLYRECESVEGLTDMIAELRDSFLDHDTISDRFKYDISTETAAGPEHVIYYVAEYISDLEKKAERAERLQEQLNAKYILLNKGNEEERYALQEENIKLSERVEELEEENKRLKETLDLYGYSTQEIIRHSESKDEVINQYERALKMYADIDNHIGSVSWIAVDQGRMAREVLEETNE